MTLFDLTDEVVVVVGGAGRIGPAVCGALADHGAEVVVADVDRDAGRRVADDIDGTYHHVDVTDETSIRKLYDAVIDGFDRIDAAVHAAYPRDAAYGDAFLARDESDWREQVDAQLTATATLSREAIRRMHPDGAGTAGQSDPDDAVRDGGAVVNFGSTYGMVAPDFRVYEEANMPPSPAHYSASKGGILNLTRYLASEFAPEVRVNAVSPGGVFDEQDPEFVAAYEDRTPMERMADPEDIAGAVVYLVSDAASYVTGENIAVDGGWTAQ
ncbi:SDR family oxidoreductase [Haloglomus halophilum]|uniref:SDR family oxidoreductase n=1 Tax=Haloglomus halophilum TaxID=2962672 RepID=UPI0020C9F456|nr:SDR family oxidoreductase [Haloglomus halophilum]